MTSSMRRTLATACCVSVLVALRFLAPVEALSGTENDVLFIILAALVAWIVRPAPYSVVGFLMLVAFWAVGVDSSLVFSGFSDDGFFFFLGVLLLSRVIVEVDLHLAIADVVTSRIRNVWQLALATPFVLFLMALPVPSATARSLTLKPIFNSLVDDDSNVGTHVMLSLGAINRIGGRAYLSGGLAAILTVSVLDQYGFTLTWTGWLRYMWVPTFLLVALSTVGITLAFNDGFGALFDGARTIERVPDVGFDDRFLIKERAIVLAVLAVVIASWVGASVLGVPEFVPLLAVLSLTFFAPVDVADEETLRTLNWDLLFCFGSGLSLSSILARTNIGPYLVENVLGAALAPTLSFPLFLVGLICVLVFVRIALIGATYVIIVLPLVIQFSTTVGHNPLVVALVALLAGSVVFFPVQSPATIVAFQGPYLTQRDTVLAGCVMFVAVLVTVFVSVFLYWPRL